jgi:uncharacterized membrane protein
VTDSEPRRGATGSGPRRQFRRVVGADAPRTEQSHTERSHTERSHSERSRTERSRTERLDRYDRSRLDQPRESRGLHMPRFDPEQFGRWSEAIARFMGTAKFLVYMTVVIVVWIGWNTLGPPQWRVDPYTFTFLTLLLSLQASYAAPLILLAQNRQADRDRLAMEEDRRRATMQKADTEYLAREIAALRIALGDVATRDFLRSELSRLTEDLDSAAARRQKADRKEQRRMAKRASELADAMAFDEPGAELAEDSELEGLERASVRRPNRKGAPRASRG